MPALINVDGRLINPVMITHARLVNTGNPKQPSCKVQLYFLVGEPISVSGDPAYSLWNFLCSDSVTPPAVAPPASPEVLDEVDQVAAAEAAALK